MLTPLDGKFHGTLKRRSDGKVVPDDAWVAFFAGDDALLPTLEFYRDKCEELGSSDTQGFAVHKLIERVRTWQDANPELCRVPRVEAG